MKSIYIRDIIAILTKYNQILKTIDYKNLDSQIKEINEIINFINLYSDISLDEIKNKFEVKSKVVNIEKQNKNTEKFKQNIELINKKEFNKIKGIKIEYQEFNNMTDIITFIESKSKEEFIKSYTLLDLNLLYYLISGNTVFKDVKKESLYNKIISYLKAMKQGVAFKNYSYK